MRRLTKGYEKHNNEFISYVADISLYPEMMGYEQTQAEMDAINKLGKLEDLEEELGIDLITLFKTLKTNIWNEKTHRQEWVVLDYSNNEFVLKTTKELYIDDNKCILLLKDYGKTWSLSRNDLEGKDDE